MPCSACGGSDHMRASSSKCTKRKRKACESGCFSKEDDDLETYTVKRCLRTFIRSDIDFKLTTAIVSRIENDVIEISRLSIELSVLVRHFYTSYLIALDDDKEFLTIFEKDCIDGLAALLTGSRRAKKLKDPLKVWESFKNCSIDTNKNYDSTLRSYLIIHAVNDYRTRLETNISTHAFYRIKRYLRSIIAPIDNHSVKEHAKRVHDAVYNRYYSSSRSSNLSDLEIDKWFDSVIPEPPTAVTIKKDFWKFVPLFWRIQKKFASSWIDGSPMVKNIENVKNIKNIENIENVKNLENIENISDKNKNKKNFGGRGSSRGSVLFPLYSVGAKHLLYDSVALQQLLRYVDKSNTPSTWSVFNAPDPDTGEAGARKYWKRYFNVPSNGKFGYSIRTDAVSVSLTMIRKIKKKKWVKGEEFDPGESKKSKK